MFIRLKKSDGFTLVELIAVLVILSVWSAVIVKRVSAISDSSERNALVQGVIELNTREALTWFNIKMSDAGFESDEKVWAEIDTSLGNGYIWTVGPSRAGGDLKFGSQTFALTRNESTKESPGKWKP